VTLLIGYILFLLVAGVVLFSLEKLSVDIITLILLLGLVVPGILTPKEAFQGFSNDIIVILASIFVISAALKDAGILDWIGAQMRRMANVGSTRFLVSMMSLVGGTSAFMNNTTVTALFTPLVTGMARKAGVSPSKLLMPLAFASILGGTCTLIGTSTNVAVSGFIQQNGMEPIGMFELTPIGLIIVLVGIIYMVFIGSRLLPSNADTDLTGDYEMREYLTEIVVLPDSPLIGQRVEDSDLTILNFNILRILRGSTGLVPERDTTVEEGDVLMVTGKVSDLMKVRKIEGITIQSDRVVDDADLADSGIKIAEIQVGKSAKVVGKTLVDLDLRERHGVTVLAIFRHGRTRAEQMKTTPLHEGDVLLVRADSARLLLLQESLGMTVMEEVGQTPTHPRRGLIILSIFIGAVLCGSLNLLPLSAAFLVAAVLCVLMGAVSAERAYQFIDWRLLVLIGGMTAFGIAMEKTGTAEFLSQLILQGLSPLGVHGILAGFFILTIILTQPMSNAAAALVVLPVAVKTAELIGCEPRTFAIGIMLAASISFIAPLEPSCILVYGPGKYRFMTFVKVGLGLTIVLSVVVLGLLTVFWPLWPE
jgi:di/tricarboxylate transporter